MRPGEAPTSWPRRPFASTLSPHRFRRLTEARHSYHGRSVSHAPQPFLYLLFPYAIMPSPDACEQCVATLSRNEQKNARHGGTMARWHDGRILKRSFGPVPFHEKMDASLRQRPKPNLFTHRAFDSSTPNGTRARQRRPSDGVSKKSLGRDSKPPESQLPYNRQPPPRQRSSKAARTP